MVGGMVFAPQYGQAPLPEEVHIGATLQASDKKFSVLVGSTRDEVTPFLDKLPTISSLIKLPVVGRLVRPAIKALLTNSLYRSGAENFAREQARAGGRASTYLLDWGFNEPLAAAHCADVALLFGDSALWSKTPALAGREWDDVERAGVALRKIWGSFAKGVMPTESDSVGGVISISDLH